MRHFLSNSTCLQTARWKHNSIHLSLSRSLFAALFSLARLSFVYNLWMKELFRSVNNWCRSGSVRRDVERKWLRVQPDFRVFALYSSLLMPLAPSSTPTWDQHDLVVLQWLLNEVKEGEICTSLPDYSSHLFLFFLHVASRELVFGKKERKEKKNK